ncbi:hypothetical protein BJ684DRAFT_21993 [Piptocephalis cylindrospora]|uniref:Methyltransferase type 11 domain-containing protein n=1 Tax=Piptocephalis cylindrospora TaxID=1907219 RepID=A0A4P9XYE4_9FUNG|nr:hypothetical protein BJ684DRAFT_21993 [Piptocephalis cylindrospora]|eukprot:RKP11438.1 hypothetical protein BJ684DRAFT_21993 [Piptocephalis cylindrospora]
MGVNHSKYGSKKDRAASHSPTKGTQAKLKSSWLRKSDGMLYTRSLPQSPVRPRSIQESTHSAEGNYSLPDIEAESERRLANLVDIIFYQYKKYFRAPICCEPAEILEIGSSADKWVAGVARLYPMCKVTGLTTHLFQGISETLPENASFLPSSSISHLPFRDNQFNLVYGLCALRYIPFDILLSVLQEILRCIQPGGYIEIWQPDYRYHDSGPAGEAVEKMVWTYLKSRGIRPEVVHHMEGLLQDAGFINVNAKTSRASIGEWAAMRGRVMANGILGMLRNMADDMIIRGDIETGEQFKTIIDAWEEEIPHTQVHTLYYSFCAQKPLQDSRSG